MTLLVLAAAPKYNYHDGLSLLVVRLTAGFIILTVRVSTLVGAYAYNC